MLYEEKEFTVKNGLKVKIRSPRRDDAKELLDFIIDVSGQTDFLLSSPGDRPYDIEKEAAFIESCIDGPNWFLIVTVDGKIIGDCGLNFNKHIKDKHRSSVGISIDKQYCNCGIGSLLFDEMIRLARETDGIEQIDLGVISGNERAKHLYEKKGFKKTGFIPNAIKLKDGTYYDEELMTLFL